MYHWYVPAAGCSKETGLTLQTDEFDVDGFEPSDTQPAHIGSGFALRLRWGEVRAKPPTDSPDFARDIAFKKIKARVEGTKMAAEKLGVS